MLLDIVTPERRLRSVETADVRLPLETDSVVLPGLEGELEVLPGHEAFFTLLGTGVLAFRAGQKNVRLMVSGGFAEIDRDRVTVMCEVAALAEEVEAAMEEKSLAEAERKLQELGAVAYTDEEFGRLKAEAERAAAKLRLLR